MKDKVKILYVQHASSLGGSVISLREVVMDALASGYDCTVVCPNETIGSIYEALGARVEIAPLAAFDHNTAYHYRFSVMDILRLGRLAFRVRRSRKALAEITERIRPSLVHLNSSTLILYVSLFRKRDIPVILHIRENISHGYFGIRKKRIREIADFGASAVIYISEYEKELLRTRADKSYVIYNYVHEHEFSSGVTIRKNSDDGPFSLINLGGLHQLKGGKVMLEAMLKLPSDFELVVLGTNDPRLDSSALERIDGKRYAKAVIELLDDERLQNRIQFGGRVERPQEWIASANALIFYATAPHFPRPVFEAWLLGKPVVYYNPDFRNEKINSDTAVFVNNQSPDSLAQAILLLRKGTLMSAGSRTAIQKIARECFTENNFTNLNRVYQKALKA